MTGVLPSLWMLALLMSAGAGSMTAGHITIIEQPKDIGTEAGGSVELCVSATGAQPLFYQWRKNGVNLKGANDECLFLFNVEKADGGTYQVVVYDESEAVQSGPAVLEIFVQQQGGNDDASDATFLTGSEGEIAGDNSGATRQEGEPFHFNRNSDGSIWFSYLAPHDGYARIDTRGSTFDTLLGVYEGSIHQGLREVASDDDQGGFHTSEVTFAINEGVEYLVAVDGLDGDAGKFILNWFAAKELAPTIEEHPRHQIVRENEDVLLEVVAVDADWYQWRFNGEVIEGEHDSFLFLPGVQTSDLGEYDVVVGVDQVTVASLPARIEFGTRPEVRSLDKTGEFFLPTDGKGGGGLRAGGGGGGGGDATLTSFIAPRAGALHGQTYSTVRSSRDCSEIEHCSKAGGASRWFYIETDEPTLVTIDTRGSVYPSGAPADTVLAVYTLINLPCGLKFTELITCNDDASGEVTSRVCFVTPPGLRQYRVVVDTAGGADAVVQFNVRFRPPPVRTVDEHPLSLILPLETSLVLQLGPRRIPSGARFQWRWNGVDLPAATNSWYPLPCVGFEDAGRYTVVTSAGGSVDEATAAILTVADFESRPARLPDTGELVPHMRVMGVAGARVFLDASSSMTSRTVWSRGALFTPTATPVQFDFTPDWRRFYRARPADEFP